METWRQIWREGFAPLVSTAALAKLREALEQDDLGLIQGATTSPPPLFSLEDCEVEGACVIGFMAWKGYGLKRVGEIDAFYRQICRRVEQRLGVGCDCRNFVHWFDDTPRREMRRELLGEILRELLRRTSVIRQATVRPSKSRRALANAV